MAKIISAIIAMFSVLLAIGIYVGFIYQVDLAMINMPVPDTMPPWQLIVPYAAVILVFVIATYAFLGALGANFLFGLVILVLYRSGSGMNDLMVMTQPIGIVIIVLAIAFALYAIVPRIWKAFFISLQSHYRKPKPSPATTHDEERN